MKRKMALALTVIMAMSTTTAFAKTEKTYKAIPTGQTVTLNGEKVKFAAYNIEGNNYFKLRDLGQALDFYVGYDNNVKSIIISGYSGYTK